jgi:hypothetical protein
LERCSNLTEKLTRDSETQTLTGYSGGNTRKDPEISRNPEIGSNMKLQKLFKISK